MAEGTFEYECMRAELLGIEKPDKELFEEARKKQLEAEQEAIDNEQMQEIDLQEEQMKNTTGKMDEINSILSVTQLKINSFKKACGSLTNLLKFRSGADENVSSSNPNISTSEELSLDTKIQGNSINDALDNLDAMKDMNNASDVRVVKQSAVDVGQKVTSHLDKLDSLINKADNAQYSMAHQTKQMKAMTRK